MKKLLIIALLVWGCEEDYDIYTTCVISYAGDMPYGENGKTEAICYRTKFPSKAECEAEEIRLGELYDVVGENHRSYGSIYSTTLSCEEKCQWNDEYHADEESGNNDGFTYLGCSIID